MRSAAAAAERPARERAGAGGRAGDRTKSPGRRLWAFLRHEPLVHFAILGGLLFGADALRLSNVETASLAAQKNM